MGKLLFWAILIVAALLAARILARQSSKNTGPSSQARPNAEPQPLQNEPMVRCQYCAIHLPRSEAVLMHGQTWCSTEHAKLGMQQKK